MKTSDSKIIVALDYSDTKDVIRFADSVAPSLCRLKVGKELFTHAGPKIVSDLIKKGFDIFLDLKFHDIPNTISGAINVAADMGVWMTDVHASGGKRMMEEAKNTLEKNNSDMLLVAVTVLTSFSGDDLSDIGIYSTTEEQALRLATLAKNSGMDGVVSSAGEARELRKTCGEDFILVTPGIRPISAKPDDQRRIFTPSQAIVNGSSYLVVGRPITQSLSPAGILEIMNDEVSLASVQANWS